MLRCVGWATPPINFPYVPSALAPPLGSCDMTECSGGYWVARRSRVFLPRNPTEILGHGSGTASPVVKNLEFIDFIVSLAVQQGVALIRSGFAFLPGQS